MCFNYSTKSKMIITGFCTKRYFSADVKKIQISVHKMQRSYAAQTCSVQQNRPGVHLCIPGRFGSFHIFDDFLKRLLQRCFDSLRRINRCDHQLVRIYRSEIQIIPRIFC